MIPHIIKVLFLGLLFMIHFTAYFSAQTLLSQIYDQAGFNQLGTILLLSTYTLFGLNNLLAPYYTKFKSSKWLMFFSCFSTLPMLFAAVITCEYVQYSGLVYFINILGGMSVGFGGAILWIAQSCYINKIANNNPSSRGTYIGVFWAFSSSSVLLGAMVSALILKYFSHTNFFLILLALSTGGWLLFILLPDIATDLHPNLNISPVQTICKTYNIIIRSSQLKKFSMLFFTSGIILAIYSGYLYKIVNASVDTKSLTDEELNVKTSFIIMILGGAQVAGGYLSGFFTDRTKVRTVGILGTGLVQMALFITLLSFYEKKYTICFFASALWGLADSFTQVVCQMFVSKTCVSFEESLVGFSVFRFFQSIGVLVSLLLNLALADQQEYTFLLLLAFLQGLSTLVLNYIHEEELETNYYILKPAKLELPKEKTQI